MFQKRMGSFDSQRFTSYAVSLLSHVQDTYVQFRAGLIDKGIWEAEKAFMAASF